MPIPNSANSIYPASNREGEAFDPNSACFPGVIPAVQTLKQSFARSVQLQVIKNNPVLEISLPNSPSALFLTSGLTSMEAFRRCVEQFPGLVSCSVRDALRAQSKQLSVSGELEYLSKIADRFIRYFRPDTGGNVLRWKQSLGSPLFLVVKFESEVKKLVFQAEGPPGLALFKTKCTEALAALAKDLLAVGRTEDIIKTETIFRKHLAIISESFRLRQLGFNNPETAKRVCDTFNVSISSDQVSTWILGQHLPAEIKFNLIESRTQRTRFHKVELPAGPSPSLSYLLGVQVGRVNFESTTEQVGIVHYSCKVIARVKKSIIDLGFEEVPTHNAEPRDGKSQQEIRLRSMALNSAFYEITYGYTRLPWVYLASAAEKKAFVRGFTDSLGVVFADRVRYTKTHGSLLLKEVAVLMSQLKIYGEVNDALSRLTISSTPDIIQLRKVLGRRYPELDKKLEIAAAPRGKRHASVAEYSAYTHACRAVGNANVIEIIEFAKQGHGVTLSARDVARWLNGKEPLCAGRVRLISDYRKLLPHIDEQFNLVSLGIPRGAIVSNIENGVRLGS